jgi:hypothetical protein
LPLRFSITAKSASAISRVTFNSAAFPSGFDSICMEQQPITAQEFTKRLAQMCLAGPSNELPRKPRDRQIVLKSISLCLAKDQTFSEVEMNQKLKSWVGEVGHALQVDHAALRRTLIDEKYLQRSADGKSYRLAPTGGAGWFAAEVDAVHPADAIQEAILEAAAKREQFRDLP